MNVHLSATAKRDLRRAARYLDRQTATPAVADRLYDQIEHALELIAENPLMGRERFWRVKKEMVQISRILHQKPDVARAFRPRGGGAG